MCGVVHVRVSLRVYVCLCVVRGYEYVCVLRATSNQVAAERRTFTVATIDASQHIVPIATSTSSGHTMPRSSTPASNTTQVTLC